MAVGFRAISRNSQEMFIVPTNTADWNRCHWLDELLRKSGLAVHNGGYPPYFNDANRQQVIALLRLNGVEVEE